MKKAGKPMGKCVIFCAGDFDAPIQPITPDDCVIAADGGLRHVQKLGLQANVILGDFDSLGFVPQGANVFPAEKDDTDALLAVRRGLALGYREFLLYGGMDGKRLDHTLANFQTLQYLADRNARGYLVGLDYIATVISQETLTFPGDATGLFSLFCLGADATGITIEGLQYALTNGTLTSGFPLGVSNRFLGQDAHITVKNGSLLAIWDRVNALPSRKSL